MKLDKNKKIYIYIYIYILLDQSIGILYFNDKETTTVKTGVIGKKFISLYNGENKIIKTKKVLEMKNMYVKIKNDHIIKYIGYVGDRDIEMTLLDELALCNWNLKINKLFNEINQDLTPDRICLLDRTPYSIDPDGSIDIDDAIHYYPLDNGYIELGIHIADPSSFIEQGSIIDNELGNRCETIYLQNKIYHMIDKDFLINNLSLLKGKIRRAYSLLIILDDNEIVSYKFIKSIIKVEQNFSYGNIPNEILLILEKYSKILKNKFIPNMIIDNYDSHKIVEIFMIVANYLCAKTITKNGEGIVRVQKQKPILGSYNHPLNNIYIKMLSNKANYQYYDKNNDNYHNALGLDLYTHFTSPIRRYADILVHHQLNNSIIREDSIIHKLNHCRSYYKYIINYEISLNIFKLIGERDYVETYGYIVYINETTCGIWCDMFNKVFITKLLNDRLLGVYDIKYCCDKIIINNKTFNLFDKIDFRICKNIYGINKINCYVMNVL